MAISNFIPTVWSARLNESLKKNLVFGNVVNHNYEGDISEQGQTVKINSIGAVTIGNYNKSTGIGTPEELSDTSLSLVVDQAKYFNFRADDIDKAQANVDIIDAAMREASYSLANVVDNYIANLYPSVDTGNLIGNDTTPIVPTALTAYDYLIDLGVKLDEANVPEIDRFVVVPAWYHGLLLKDARFTKDSKVMATGYIGSVDNMVVFKSNNTPSTGTAKYKIIAGYKGAITFAGQITETEAFRPESFFADAVKGLMVYGAKLINPYGLAVLTANKA